MMITVMIISTMSIITLFLSDIFGWWLEMGNHPVLNVFRLFVPFCKM